MSESSSSPAAETPAVYHPAPHGFVLGPANSVACLTCLADDGTEVETVAIAELQLARAQVLSFSPVRTEQQLPLPAPGENAAPGA